MEKISGILPSNSRISTVDLKSGSAARPGMPTFGRKSGTSALNGGGGSTTADKAMEAHLAHVRQPLTSKDKADIVSSISDGFFMKKQKLQESPVDLSDPMYSYQPVPQEVLDSGPSMGPSPVALTEPAANPAMGKEVELANAEADLDEPEVGRYLDVSV